MAEFMGGAGQLLGWVITGIGHAYILTGILNYLYGRPISKLILKLARLAVGVCIVGFPFLMCWLTPGNSGALSLLLGPYLWGCFFVGSIWFPVVTALRYFRRVPACVTSVQSKLVDIQTDLGFNAVVGNGRNRWMARLPGNDIYRVEFSDTTLAIPGLPVELTGLTVLLLSDLHFHGTPSREWFERVFDLLRELPEPEIVVLAGDIVDTDRHHDWIVPLLGRLQWSAIGVAILGNHDAHHRPECVQKELANAGYFVLSNRWTECRVRGQRCAFIGHEGPWIGPPPDMSGLPSDAFKICVSHTPDNFPWGVAHGINLVLCGHVHGGQIRLPVIGSIFVPSVFGRKYDMGVFAEKGTVMVVGRGLSGKEPLRWRCPPQVIRLTLTPACP